MGDMRSIKMMEIGRLCVKVAGRDARQKCVILKNYDNNYVLIDGQTRRRKCNIAHLEPLNQVLEIAEDADHNVVMSVFEKELDIKLTEKKSKEKKERPVKTRKSSEKEAEEKPKK
jgi:large subunit ribosomal protein L14e